MEHALNLRSRSPPRAVIAFDEHFLAGALAKPFKVRKRLLQIEPPGNVAADKHFIVRADHAVPRFAHLPLMAHPLGSKDVHRLVGAEAEMQVTDGEQSHGWILAGDWKLPDRTGRSSGWA